MKSSWTAVQVLLDAVGAKMPERLTVPAAGILAPLIFIVLGGVGCRVAFARAVADLQQPLVRQAIGLCL